MDLEEALDVANRPLSLLGECDPSLAKIVSGRANEEVRAVRELDGDHEVRVADVLLSLAVATAPKIDNAELYDVYRRWAQLRYLGAFAAWGASDDRLGLSPVGAAVAGSQRRVFSEELGIGFATWLSQYWRFPGAPASRTTRQLVDADLAWAHGVGGSHIAPVGPLRPDYVIVQQNVDGSSSMAFLECKGSSNRNTSLRQLVKASKQLTSGRIDHLQPSGLALSTVMNRKEMRYLAIQRPWSETFRQSDTNPLGGPESGVDLVQPQDVVDHSLWGAADDYTSLPETDAPPVRLREFGNPREAADVNGAAETGLIGIATSTAMVASWSVLADLAGNEEAFARWTSDRSQRPERTRQPRARTDFVTVGRDTIRGVSNMVAVPGGRLEVVLGVLDFVDEALRDGSSAAINDAQRRAAAMSGDRIAFNNPVDGEVTAFGADGSALVLRAAE